MDSKVLIVSKPIYNNIMPLVDFPKNKDIYNLDNVVESIAGEANVAAYILGKYGVVSSYTGITGNDEAGNNFKKVLCNVNVDTKFMEVDFEGKTDVTYTIINTEKIGFSHIKVNSMKKDLTKFKYDFNPSFIVFDDKDFSGANAALNNYPNVKSIFYGKNPNKDAINMCKRADYIVCNINFASKLTGLEISLNKPKSIIALYQKLVDLFKGVWIITLGEYGVIYSNDNQVKMIPVLKNDVLDRDKAGSVFFGTFSYAIVSGMDIENAVRLANINASCSLKTIGSINGLMNINELLKYKIIDTKEVVEQIQNINAEQIVLSNQQTQEQSSAQVETINNDAEVNLENLNSPIVQSTENVEILENLEENSNV